MAKKRRATVTRQRRTLDPGLRKILRLTDSGILALSIIAVVQFLSFNPPLAFPLNVSLYGFAICIPLAGAQAFMLGLEEHSDLIKNSLGGNVHGILAGVAVLFFYIGTLYMISHLSFWASIVFGVASSVPYALFYLMGLAGTRRYFVAVGLFFGVLLLTAFLLAVGHWHPPCNPFYDLLHQFPCNPFYDLLHQLP